MRGTFKLQFDLIAIVMSWALAEPYKEPAAANLSQALVNQYSRGQYIYQ